MNLFAPSTILYPPYLVSAFFVTILWLKKNSGLSWRESFQAFFRKEIWFSKEILIDLFFCLFILLFLKRFIGPIEDWIFIKQLNFLNNFFEYQWNFQLSPMAEGLLATLITMIAIDGASYFTHKGMHSNEWLWKTHRFHHSIKHLNFLSTHRQHPLEFIILNIARTMAAGLGLSLLHWFFPSETPVMTIQGLGAGFFIYMFTVNLHHSHIPVCYPKFLRYILISPHVHHLHHSANPLHFGKNYGVVFSFWDRAFGTYYEEPVKIGELRFGNDHAKTHSPS